MKLLYLLFLSILVGCTAKSQEIEYDKSTLSEIWLDEYNLDQLAILENEQIKEAFDLENDLKNLLFAKYKIINGDLKLAKFYLNRINEKDSTLRNLRKRYMAIVYFIEGKYSESLNSISSKEFESIGNIEQVCQLKIINKMALNINSNLKYENDICKAYTMKYSKNDQYWMEVMLKLKQADPKEIERQLLTDLESTLNNDEMSKIWLKSGLFLNKETDFLSLLSSLNDDAFESNKIREIVAFMYLRNKNLQRALSFIEGIESANAYNIKGNINLIKEEYELAYGNFKLALSKKGDSQNAIDRAIPLAWILGQWEDGVNLLNSSTNISIERNKRALKTAFYIRNKNYIDAKRELILLKKDFQGEPPFEVNIMDSFVSMILPTIDKIKYDKRRSEDSAEKGCRSFDGISCYLALSHIAYENLGKTIMRKDETFSDKEMTIESLKQKQEILPLTETITVDQHDIEELDSENVKLSTR